MTANRILHVNAIATAASGLGMLLARGTLFQLFGATGPALFDLIGIAFIGYAAIMWMSARQPHVDRGTLIAFTVVDSLWVAGSAVVLLMFWNQLAPLARLLVIAVAIIVDVFAMLQFRAAGHAPRRQVA